MRWKQDLISDIRTFTPFDNQDKYVDRIDPWNGEHAFSLYNQEMLTDWIKACKPEVILEIGVCKNDYRNSSTRILIEHKPINSKYFGVDLADKSFLDDKNVSTIRCNSSEYLRVILEVGKKIDFIMIDGDHSINQVLTDWQYVDDLSEHGVICLHDTRYHPGPNRLINNLNGYWWVIPDACKHEKYDYGLGFVWR